MPARRKSTKKTKETPHRLGRDVAGLMLIALGIFALISVFFSGTTGAFGEAVADVLFGLFGVAARIMPLFTIVAGWLVMISWKIRIHKGKLGSVSALLLLLTSLIHLFYDGLIRSGADGAPAYGAYLSLAFRFGVEKGGGAGVLGGLLVWPLHFLLGRVGTFIFVIAALIGCGVLLTRFSLGGAGRRVTEAAYAATTSAIGQARERRHKSIEPDVVERKEPPVRAKEKIVAEPEDVEPEFSRADVSDVPSYTFDKREKRVSEPPSTYGVYEPQPRPPRKLPNEKIRSMKGSRRRPEPDIIDLSTGRKVSVQTIREELEGAPKVAPFPTKSLEDEGDHIFAFEPGNAYGAPRRETSRITPFPMESMEEESSFDAQNDYFQEPRGVSLKEDDMRTLERIDSDFEREENAEEWETPGEDEWNTRTADDWDSPLDELPDNLNAYDGVDADELGLPVHEEIEDEGITIPEELPEVDEFEPEPELDLPTPVDTPVIATRREGVGNAFGNPAPSPQPVAPPPQPVAPPLPPPYRRPQLDLLSRPVDTEAADLRARSEQEERANLLLSTLKSFGISSSIVGISRGPTLTRYELKPAAGIKVSRIVGLSDDIAMNMAAAGVRIEAPIPGKAAIGIEVPNLETFPVALREVLTSEDFQGHKSRLAIAFGMDITGKPVVGDLADMPHLLIAGATGSGKSVCINSLVTSILYKSSPEDVKLIMIDPKVVELSVYNGIPHLLIPVVTDPKKAAGALNWAVQEMESRYKKFAATNSRDLKGYNAYARANGMETIYQLVVIVDELADLMIVASREVEEHINRLAQLARAAGIHLVIATQRPSVNVITGVIKANIPSRIAFAVASQVDSRTILDVAGAEKLLGRGDMLFHPRGASKPRRVQGCLITDAEVHRVVDVVKRTNGEVLYNPEVIETLERLDAPAAEQVSKDDDDGDDLLRQAIELALDAGQVSASMLQRRYRIGYARAGRLIDEMEQRGIISGHEGSKPREVLLSREEFNRMYLQ